MAKLDKMAQLDVRRLALAALAMFALGCPTGVAPPGTADGGYPGTDTDAGLSFVDSAVDDSLAPFDSAVDSTVCQNGNLLTALPTQPTLCRPFPAPQPSTMPQDPSTCQDVPKVVLTASADNYVGGDNTRDIVSGMEGQDIIQGNGCSDELNGNTDDDQLMGNAGNDKLYGGQGDDTIQAGQGHDSIWGGGGDDTISPGGGDDQVFFSEGCGHDVIQESDGHDTIVCAAVFGMPKARLVTWSRVGDDLLLTMSGSGSITVKAFFTSAGASIDAIVGCE